MSSVEADESMESEPIKSEQTNADEWQEIKIDLNNKDLVRYRLMAVYKIYEILWNPKNPRYGKAKPTKLAWNELAQKSKIQQMTGIKAKHELVSLCKRYKEKCHVRATIDENIRHPEWFDVADMFLRPIVFEDCPGRARRSITKNRLLNEVFLIETNPKEVQAVDTLIAKIEAGEDIDMKGDFMAEVKLENENPCRACLKTYADQGMEMFCLQYTYVDDLQLAKIYNEHIGYSSPDEESLLPRSICLECRNILLEFREFRFKCRTNETIFLEHANKVKRLEEEYPETSMPLKEADVFDEDSMIDSAINDDGQIVDTSVLVCGEEESPKRLEILYSQSEKKRFKCGQCEKSYSKKCNLLTHFRDFHKLGNEEIGQVDKGFKHQRDRVKILQPEKYNVQCGQCEKRYSRKPHLWVHLRDTHKLAVEEIAKIKMEFKKNENKVKMLPPEKYKYKCNHCERTFSKKSNLFVHLRGHHNATDDDIAQLKAEFKIQEANAEKPPPSDVPKTYSICQVCGKSVRSLHSHMLAHDADSNVNAQRFECTLCGRHYKLKEYLKVHMKIAHQGLKYNCQLCPKSFTTWGGRRMHLHLKHFNLNPDFECDICKQLFPSELTLRTHLRQAHTTKKTHQCDICSQCCSTSDVLKQHKIAKHTDTTFPCDECGKGFSTKQQLQRHYQLHTGERNYECPVCLKLFGQNLVLRGHVEKLHPDYELPPKGTVMHKRALEQMAVQREIEKQYVKIDCAEIVKYEEHQK